MMATWPSTIPWIRPGYTETGQETFITTQMDSGPSQRRGRFTASSRYLDADILMSVTEFNSFETFYNVTLKRGVDKFNGIDPKTKSVKEFRFISRYSAIAEAFVNSRVDLWRVTLPLEILP